MVASRLARLASASPSRLDHCDVDLGHLHHRFECPLGRCTIRVGQRCREGAGDDLLRHTPLVLAPATDACFAPIADYRVPQPVGFGLVIGGDLGVQSQEVMVHS